MLAILLVVFLLASSVSTAFAAGVPSGPPEKGAPAGIVGAVVDGISNAVTGGAHKESVTGSGPGSGAAPQADAPVTLKTPTVRTQADYADKINRFTSTAAVRVDVIPTSGNVDVRYEYDSSMDAKGTGYYTLGTHSGRVRAVDQDGNVSEWASFDFEVANRAPTAPSIEAVPDYSDYVNGFTPDCMVKVEINVRGSDPDGHDAFQYEYEAGTVNASGYYAAGQYTVKARTVDEWGATSDWSTAVFFG